MCWPSIHVFCNHQGNFKYIIPESYEKFNLRNVQYAYLFSRCFIGHFKEPTKSLPLEGKVSGAEPTWLNVTEIFRA